MKYTGGRQNDCSVQGYSRRRHQLGALRVAAGDQDEVEVLHVKRERIERILLRKGPYYHMLAHAILIQKLHTLKRCKALRQRKWPRSARPLPLHRAASFAGRRGIPAVQFT